MRASTLLLAIAVIALAGCGGGSAGAPTAQAPRQSAASPATGPAGDAQVIRRWADTLRTGDVAGAARLFALPTVTVVTPGAPALELRTRGQAQAFNRSLPCGAVLLRTEREQGMTVGVFRLTERPGATCDGTGAVARTAFVIERGRITHWIRLPDRPGAERAPATPGGEPQLV